MSALPTSRSNQACLRKVPKRKPGCLCRAFPPYVLFPPSKVFARSSPLREMAKHGRTGATKWPRN